MEKVSYSVFKYANFINMYAPRKRCYWWMPLPMLSSSSHSCFRRSRLGTQDDTIVIAGEYVDGGSKITSKFQGERLPFPIGSGDDCLGLVGGESLGLHSIIRRQEAVGAFHRELTWVNSSTSPGVWELWRNAPPLIGFSSEIICSRYIACLWQRHLIKKIIL